MATVIAPLDLRGAYAVEFSSTEASSACRIRAVRNIVSVRRITFLSPRAESPTTGRHGARDTKDVGGARATLARERVDRARVRASSGDQPGNASLVELAAS